jgi:hypothetical protein
MTQTAEVALVAQKWTNIVQSCCPGLARAEWHVNRGDDIVITGWFRPRACERDDTGLHLQKVEIAVSQRTVDDYIHAPALVQFHANGQLIDFITFGWLRDSFHGPADCDTTEPEQWLVDSADLGLEDQQESRQWWWAGLRRHVKKRSSS